MEQEQNKRAALVSIIPSQKEAEECMRSLDELARLLDTAGGEEVFRLVQVKEAFNAATCLGSGKVEELRDLCQKNDVGLAVFDFELSPSQIRNLEEKTGVHVIDRTMLILDIFALHAVTGEGKLQVELAQLRYTAPRLTGQGAALSRQGGGIGSRGPGESKLESDRRHIHRRITALTEAIAEMEHNRGTMRAARDRSGIPRIAIVGYTNAGKSTLLNRLTDAGVLSEDKLFATLDPTTRRLALPGGEDVLLTDTVGLIRRLPHHLIKAFRSTLDEAALSDILLIVADASDAECAEHLMVTRSLLSDLGAADKPTIVVYNKCDRLDGALPEDDTSGDAPVYISAATGEGIDRLLLRILAEVRRDKRRVTLFFSYAAQSELNRLCNTVATEDMAYLDDGVRVTAVLDHTARGMFREYIVDDRGTNENGDDDR